MARAKNKSADQVAASAAPVVAPPPAAPLPPPPKPEVDIAHLFKPEDWIAALVTFLFSGSVCFYYMSPEVTLQDSGELVTGAFNFFRNTDNYADYYYDDG